MHLASPLLEALDKFVLWIPWWSPTPAFLSGSTQLSYPIFRSLASYLKVALTHRHMHIVVSRKPSNENSPLESIFLIRSPCLINLRFKYIIYHSYCIQYVNAVDVPPDPMQSSTLIRFIFIPKSILQMWSFSSAVGGTPNVRLLLGESVPRSLTLIPRRICPISNFRGLGLRLSLNTKPVPLWSARNRLV